MKKVLIIDDEEDIRTIISEFCKIFGIDTIIAENGKEGIEKYKQEKSDLIFTDIKMPDMDGFQLVKKIRELDRNVPIVVCSGFIDEINKKKILDCGANSYIEKPFKLQDFKDILQQYSII